MTIRRFTIDIKSREEEGGIVFVHLDANGKMRIVENDELGRQVAAAEYDTGDSSAEEFRDALTLKIIPGIMRLRPIVATDVYYVDVPADCGDREERAGIAINEAREGCGVYAVPSVWEALVEEDCGEVVVTRQRRASQKFPEERLSLPRGEEE